MLIEARASFPLCLSHIQPRASYDFYHPYDFLPVRSSEAPVGIIRWCCSRGHIRLRAPFGLTRLYTYGLVEWFAGLHGYPVQCPYGHRMGPARESSMFFISYRPIWGSCGTRKGAIRHPHRHVRELIQPELTKIPHGCRIWPYGARTGPLRSPHRLFTGCLWSQNPDGACKLIMHTLKLYGPCTGRQNSYGATRGLCCWPHEWICYFCSKQPGNSPYGSREYDVTEALSRNVLLGSLYSQLPVAACMKSFCWLCFSSGWRPCNLPLCSHSHSTIWYHIYVHLPSIQVQHTKSQSSLI